MLENKVGSNIEVNIQIRFPEKILQTNYQYPK